MAVGEDQPLRREPVDVGRWDLPGPVHAHVAVPNVIPVNDDDIRPVLGRRGGGTGLQHRAADQRRKKTTIRKRTTA